MTEKRLMKNERGYWFFELRSGAHWKYVTRIWVHRSMVPAGSPPDSPPSLTFPIKGRVERTEKGSLVLRPAENYVYLIEVDSGYRGYASIEVIGGEVVASGEDFHSPRGNLGETAWAIINAQAEIKVTGKRTGRHLPRDGEIIEFTVFPDGQVISEEEIDVMELL